MPGFQQDVALPGTAHILARHQFRENWWDHERKNLLNNLYLKTNRRLEVAVRRFVKNVSTDTVKSVHNISAIGHLLK